MLVTHYNTPDLLDRAVTSFRSCYPEVDVLVVDNGSDDGSSEVLDRLAAAGPGVHVDRLGQNLHHGPAMDAAIRTRVSTKYVFTLDSDTETRRGGFLEAMIGLLDRDAASYACGHVVRVNRLGFAHPHGKYRLSWVPYMLLKRDVYLLLPPFERHGVPNLATSRAAQERGLTVLDFPIADYVHHIGRGTVERHGYGLGWRAKVDRILNEFGLG